MMHFKRIMPIAWAVFSLFIISETAFAQGKSGDAKGRNYGIGQPKTVSELPYGKLRKNLEKLPPKAQAKALGWLQRVEFPAEDVESLGVNSAGDIFYSDTLVPEASDTPIEQATEFADPLSASQVFSLHSNPGASNVVYLDFDGHVIEGTAWSSNTLVALPYDPSQNDNPPTTANFTADELGRIHEIWHRMSEDFAAFNIDVTTEEPEVFTSTTGRVLFTHDVDANGLPMPSQGAGGVAYLSVFGWNNYSSRYSPALVYYTNLASSTYGIPSYNAEAGSHEFGHNLGLSHDGISGGSKYYEGHGSGLVSWAPIMGNSYYNNVTQWSKGEYSGANNTQDDLSVIAEKLGYMSDDHGDSSSNATPIRIESNGDVLVSSPELDPENLLPDNKGIIDDRNDVDWFYFDLAGSGSINITATPSWHSFTVGEKRGSNLDIEITLLDSNLDIIDFGEPGIDTFASVSASVPAGRYFIVVDGIFNNTTSDYSDYSSIGMYFLEGLVEGNGSANEPDTIPPTPGTMEWAVAPRATGTSSIEMTAVEASDESGAVEYLFTCVAGENGCVPSGWQSSNSYQANGLTPDTFYSFNVRARDASGNENEPSRIAGDTTYPEQQAEENKAPIAVASYPSETSVITKGKTATVTLDGTDSSDPDGTIVSWLWTDESGETVGTSANESVKLREGTHQFQLTVTDDQGAEGSTSLVVTVTVEESDNGGGKGKSPKG